MIQKQHSGHSNFYINKITRLGLVSTVAVVQLISSSLQMKFY